MLIFRQRNANWPGLRSRGRPLQTRSANSLWGVVAHW